MVTFELGEAGGNLFNGNMTPNNITIPANAPTGQVTITVTSVSNPEVKATHTINVTGATQNTAPSAPTNLTATPGDGEVALNWTAPASDGGSAIIRYEFTRNSGATWTTTGSGMSTYYLCTGLNNGTNYTFQVRAVNSVGAGISTGAVSATPVAAPGTAGNPFKVTNHLDLQKVGSGTDGWSRSAHYQQTDNISISAFTDWQQLGTYSNPFTGTYNGGGYTISGLRIWHTGDAIGLFGEIRGGTVKNLGLLDVYVVTDLSGASSRNIGGIAGVVTSGGKIENCYVRGTSVSGISSVGGIVGSVDGGTVSDCFTSITVIAAGGPSHGSRGFAGGIAGNISNGGKVTNCYATGEISGQGNIGGIAGGITGAGSSITGSVALNSKVATSGVGLNLAGRIVGSNNLNGATLSENAAFDGMAVEGTTPETGTASNRQGLNLTKANAKLQNTYSGSPRSWRFGSNEANPWKWGGTSYPLPLLWHYDFNANSMTLPTHLQ
jgi:hypothetical protein